MAHVFSEYWDGDEAARQRKWHEAYPDEMGPSEKIAELAAEHRSLRSVLEGELCKAVSQLSYGMTERSKYNSWRFLRGLELDDTFWTDEAVGVMGVERSVVSTWAEFGDLMIGDYFPRDGEHVLYRHFDRDGKLLYVGISRTFLTRQRAHRRANRWWDDVASITVRVYESRDACSLAETQAINTEFPYWNVQGVAT